MNNNEDNKQPKCITINYYYAFAVRVKVILGLLICRESAIIRQLTNSLLFKVPLNDLHRQHSYLKIR